MATPAGFRRKWDWCWLAFLGPGFTEASGRCYKDTVREKKQNNLHKVSKDCNDKPESPAEAHHAVALRFYIQSRY